jgi:hypothetical protein
MTDQLGPDFGRRLRAGLARVTPPTPRPENARFNQVPAGHRPILRAKPALAFATAFAALILAASAVAGSPGAGAWTQRAVTTVETVAHVVQPSPQPQPAASPKPKPKAAAVPAPAKASAPVGGSSPEQSRDAHGQPSSTPSPEAGPTPPDDHHEAPGPSPNPYPSPNPGDGPSGQGH